jgi:hypothetical protein
VNKNDDATSTVMRGLRLLALFSAMILCAGCHKTEMQTAGSCACPTEIEVKQDLEQLPEGWADRNTNVRWGGWAGPEFFDGDPRQGGVELKPKLSPVVKQNFTRTWHFNQRTGPAKLWMVCKYHRTSVMLLRPVANEVSECSGEFDIYGRSPSVTCR